ncbi:MAG: HEAT repeat domain-containing protein [Chloroherpetonaceae bacterium]|nr:HEAT repeat domain-containing protein [Chthonomonadaceae bacterium]MDW8209038.1 HEAT repeat domain-containing protein [Chloroherpetonaceae bacterium]
MMQVIAYVLIGLGLTLLLTGLFLIREWPSLPAPFWTGVLASVSVMAVVDWLRRPLREWARDTRMRWAHQRETEQVAQWTPHLLGDYPPYVIEAARALGETRDPTAVPALLRVLEQCVDMQRPSWREIAEAIIDALAQIGDRRALPLLYRIENVRGIGLIPCIREAIAAIEPQTSLLRPGCPQSLSEALLRPARHQPECEEPALLLRAAGDGCGVKPLS